MSPILPLLRSVAVTVRRPRPLSRSYATENEKPSDDPRLRDLGRTLSDEYAVIRKNYRARTPKNPIVLVSAYTHFTTAVLDNLAPGHCHGLLGFDEIRLAGNYLPSIKYWRGITEALKANGVDVIIGTVPASGSIEDRAAALAEDIEAGAKVATPHRGSSFADYCLEFIGKHRLPRVYKAAESLGMQTGAFQQLTTTYMEDVFNRQVRNDDSVRYFSFGATTQPSLLSMFRLSHGIIEKLEGPNDGLVSVRSARWGVYKGTLVGPSHLDIINWTNRLKWMIAEATGGRRTCV
ncbi:lipase 2 [Rhizina undulata]